VGTAATTARSRAASVEPSEGPFTEPGEGVEVLTNGR
jgi:hypothetical protein